MGKYCVFLSFVRRKGRLRFNDAALMALKMKENPTNKRMQVTSRIWERKENEFSPRFSSHNSTLPTHWF